MRVPKHESTTAQLGAAYPFVASAGLGVDRVVIGRDVYGSTFAYDPFELYRCGILTNPNMVVLGQVGRGKSALVKSYLYRQFAFGRKVIVIDPKGEYASFARSIDAEVINLSPSSSTSFNPLAVTVGRTDERAAWSLQQSTLEGITSASLARGLGSDEVVVLQIALARCREIHGQLSLAGVIEALVQPLPEDAKSLYLSVSQLAQIGRMPSFALQRLLGGEFQQMFRAKDNAGVRFDSRALILDVSAFYRSDALSILLIALFGALQQIVREADTPTMFVIDEAWAVLSNPVTRMFLQSFFKLARSYGVSNVLVAHRPSDLDHLNVGGSTHPAGLLSDCETSVTYALTPTESIRAQALFGLNNRQQRALTQLTRGMALWRVAQRTFLVQHQVSLLERTFIDTDERMRL
jgi:type IV secretory pathway VirB4 component